MHTFAKYQQLANAASADVTLTSLAHNSITASDGAVKIIAQWAARETGEALPEEQREQMAAFLGAQLYNAAMLASLIGLDLSTIADAQIERLQNAKTSGQLRRAATGTSQRV